MKYVFFLVFFAFIFLMMGYVLLRGWQVLPSKNQLTIFIAGLYVLLFLVMLSGLFLEKVLNPGLSNVFTFIGYSFLMVVIYMLVSFLLVDVIRLINAVFHFASPDMLIFRSWVAGLSMGFITIAMAIGNYQFNHPALTRLEISFEKPRLHKKITIVAASDIHLGSSIDKKRLRKYVQLINDRHPDLILLAGDITDRSFGSVMEQNMQEELSMLKAPMGVYAISGNHEFYSGVPKDIAQYLSASGITVLHDSVAQTDNNLYIIGREDATNRRRKPLSELVKGLNPDLPKLLLDHQPYGLDEARNNGIDLQISGHTHNGQFFPGNLIVKRMFELSYGYLRKGDTHYYVSSGLGIWGPQYRIGTKSELVEITVNY